VTTVEKDEKKFPVSLPFGLIQHTSDTLVTSDQQKCFCFSLQWIWQF